jgi:ankyrin repeat protein
MSRWHTLDPEGSAGLREVAQLLLDAGADPNTTVGGRPGRPEYCSTLFAAAGVQANAELTELLLDRGATPDEHTVYLAAFHDDRRPLEVLLRRSAPIDDTVLAAPLSTGDAEVTRLLLQAVADAGHMIPPEALGEGDPGEMPVPVAVRNGHSAELVELLLQNGGDPNMPARDGHTPYRLAVRQGRRDLADLLVAYGADPDTSDVDQFLDACLRADRVDVERRLAADPGLMDRLTATDRAAILQAADTGNTAAIELLLDVGFPLNARAGDDGATPLHIAAAAGSVEVVRLLLDRGAEVHARDTTWDSTPVVWASVGSGMKLGRAAAPDWVTTIELLIDAGASAADAWLTGAKAPSPEVADLLRAHGVADPAG